MIETGGEGGSAWLTPPLGGINSSLKERERYKCICMHAYIYVCMYVLYAYIRVCMHLCVYACMYICMHVCIRVYM